MGVNCQTAREAISALLDDEDPAIPGWVVDDHLHSCAECRGWQAEAHTVTRSARLAAVSTVGVGSDEMVAAVLTRSTPPRRPTSITLIRAGLVAVGAAQVAITAPLLLFGRDHAAPQHVAHEVGAFAVALGIGFVVAAWKPERARGMQAVVGAAAVLLVVTALLDLFHGRTDVGDEAPHLLAVGGWLLLARLAAATPESSPRPSWSLGPMTRARSGRRVSVSALGARSRAKTAGSATAARRRRAG